MTETTLPTYHDYVPDAEGRDQIMGYVHFHPHGGGPPRVPPRVRTSVVESVLNDEVKPGLKPEGIQFAANVARFYRINAVAGKFLSLLQRHEKGVTDILAALAAVRAAADLGDKTQLAAAEQYYGYLLRQNPLEEFADAAIETVFDLSDAVNEKLVDEALNKRIEALKAHTDERSQDARNKLAMQSAASLPITVEARAQKNKMLAQTDAKARATELAVAYVGIDDPGGVDWRIWGSYALREELLKSGDALLVAAFEAAGAKIPADGEEDDIDNMKAAAARAIAYFGGKLDEQHQEWIAKDKVSPLPLEG